MNLKMSIAYIILSIIVFNSCGLDKEKNNAVRAKQIDLFNIDSLEKDFLPIKDCKYIPLETNSNCLIGSITKILFQDDRIYVSDERFAKSVFVFTNTGKFLFKVGNRGQGPTEYINLNEFDIDSMGNIFLHDQERKRILKFDNSGQFVEYYSYGFYISKFAYLDNDHFFLVRGNYSNHTMKDNKLKDNTCFIWSKSKRDIVDKFFACQGENVEIYGGANRIYRSKNTINYIRPYEDLVFSLNGDKIIEKYKILIDQKRLPKNEFNSLDREKVEKFNRDDDTFSIYNFFENEKFIVFILQSRQKRFCCVMNKENDKIIVSPTFNKKKEVSFNFLGQVVPEGVYNDYFISVIEGRPLESYIKQAKDKQKIFQKNFGHLGVSKMLEDLEPGSNPIIVLYNFQNI
ncbi:MAG: 6-bladed beta-propeller [Alphaproteobacteria bacterium]|nr:6-bladed beta-propeller [Alphaproteobacteria bacterium]